MGLLVVSPYEVFSLLPGANNSLLSSPGVRDAELPALDAEEVAKLPQTGRLRTSRSFHHRGTICQVLYQGTELAVCELGLAQGV